LSSITTSQAKEIGRGVLKYRRVIDFLLAFQHTNIQGLLIQNIDWDDLLKNLDVKEIKVVNVSSRFRPLVFLIKNDDSFYEFRNPVLSLNKMANEWSAFRLLHEDIKSEIISALLENDQHSISMLRHREQRFEKYLEEYEERQNTDSTTITISRSTLTEQAKSLDDDDDTDYSSTDNDRT